MSGLWLLLELLIQSVITGGQRVNQWLEVVNVEQVSESGSVENLCGTRIVFLKEEEELKEAQGGGQAICDIKNKFLLILQTVQRLREPIVLSMCQQSDHLLAFRRASCFFKQRFIQD